MVSPCKTTTSPEQVHKGHTDEAVHIQDQVGFLTQQNQHTGERRLYYLKIECVDFNKSCERQDEEINLTLDVVIFSTSRA